MAAPPMTAEQIARLRREFADLQDDLQNLTFPEDLLEGFDDFAKKMDASSVGLTRAARAAEENAAALTRLEAINSDMSRSQAERDAAAEEWFKREQVRQQLTTAAADAAADFETTILAQRDALDRANGAFDLYNEALEALNDPARGLPEATRLLGEAHEAQERYNRGLQTGAAEADALAQSILGVSGGLGRLGGMLAAGQGGADGFSAAMLEMANSGELALNVGLKLIETSINMLKYQVDFALKQDKVISDFRKATGAGNEFNDMILATEVSLRQSGVELEESAAAYRTLKNEVVGFTNLSKEQQMAIAETSALLAEMGFSLSTQADITQTAMESMNMSVDESQELLLDLASTARSLGTDVDKLGQAFVANKEFIVGFGKDGAKIFEELAVKAKSLGVEVGLLTKTADQFTKFDQAGKHVGRLNAILGGPFLNSIDMLNASMEDPAEAINMLRDAVDQAGVSLEDMGKAEKMAMADALGMSIEDMTNIMGKSNEEIEIQRIEQEQLAEQSRQTMAITEQLKKAFQAFYINLKPFLDNVLVPMVGVIASIGAGMGKFFASTGGMVTFFGIMGALFGAGIGLMLAFTAAIPVVGPALAAAASTMVWGYLGMGAAIGGGVGLVTGGIVAAASGPAGASEKKEKPKARFAAGGVVSGTTTAMVGEQGPEMVEMPVGSRVSSAPTTLELTNAIYKLTKKLDRMNTDRGNIAVYVGDKEVTDIVIKSLNSPKGKRFLSPYGA